jgi:exodeoxyribonuclease-3
MRLVSWNVNGLRSCYKKGFSDWLQATDAQIVGLQEVRALPEQLTQEQREPDGWTTHFSPAERKGYSGVAFYARRTFEKMTTSLDEEQFDCEGRVQIGEWGPLVVANVYFPNGSGKNRDNSRIPYKLDFYRRLFDVLEIERKKGRPVVVMGDFNTAHREIDLARPKQNHKTSGFCPNEREELERWIQEGWVDSFRHVHGDAEGHYTWWSNRKGVRERNVGWRIDYALVSEAAMPFLKDATVHSDVLGSDHCPISLDFDEAVFEVS